MPTHHRRPANKELSLTFFVDPGNRVYVRHITFNGVDQDQRRSAAPRDAPARRRLAVERRARPFQAAPRAPAVHQEGGVRDQAGRRLRRPRRRRLTRSRKARPRSSAAASAIRSPSRFILNGNYAEATSWAPAGASRSTSTPASTARCTASRSPNRTSRANGVGSAPATSRIATRRSSCPRRRTSRRRRIGAGFDIGYPISEYQGLRLGLQFQKSSLLTSVGGSARQAIEWVDSNGDSDRRASTTTHDPVVRRPRSSAPNTTRSSSPPRGTTTAAIARCSPTAACATRSAGLRAARRQRRASTTSRATISSSTSRCAAGSRCSWAPTSPTAWTSARPRRCRRTGSSTPADRRRCAATARAGWGPRTTSANPSAAT